MTTSIITKENLLAIAANLALTTIQTALIQKRSLLFDGISGPGIFTGGGTSSAGSGNGSGHHGGGNGWFPGC